MIGLNYRDTRPIYEQIKESYKRLILSGAVAPGEKLPSVRELATQLAINPNTIQRAYRELENEGFIYTVAGKGCFAASRGEVDAAKVKDLLEKLDELVDQLTLTGMSRGEIAERIKKEGDK